MSREPRGGRYKTLKNAPFEQFILQQLRYLDFDQTRRWYRKIEKSKRCNRSLLAFLGCNDRFFLLTRVLGRKDAMHPWIFNRCREVEANPDDHIDLWARFHYKSTIITFAGAIQEAICNPEMTIAIFSVTQAIARKFLAQIKIEFESNGFLRNLYRDVIWRVPKTQAPTWGVAGGLTLRRVGNPKEATIEAHGLIDGQPTGRHFNLHIYDDVVTQDYMSDDMIEKTTLRWEMADNLGVHDGARKWVAGTRYNFADTYGVMMQRGSFIPRIYAATHNGKLDGKPVFLTQEHWDRIKRDQQSTVSAQMLLNPAYGNDATFNPTWFKTYEVIPAVMNVYIMCDPSKGRGARSDRTAIAVIGIDQGGNKYFLDGVRHRMKLSDRYAYMSRLYHKWRTQEGVQEVKIGYEIYGQQVDLEVIEEYQQRDNDYFKIEELNTPSSGPHAKNDRIERLEPDLKGGSFYLPAVVYHPDYAEISNGRAIWKPWLDEDDKRANKTEEEGNYLVGQVIYRPLLGFTSLQRKVSQRRVVNPVRRIDENNKPYDVTRALIGEIQEHPFGHYKDLIDATSRIYDMNPIAPKKYDVASLTGIEDDFSPESGSDGSFSLEDDFDPTDASVYGAH
jgi:hypothetical protein